jgi:hypothetical protein
MVGAGPSSTAARLVGRGTRHKTATSTTKRAAGKRPALENILLERSKEHLLRLRDGG